MMGVFVFFPFVLLMYRAALSPSTGKYQIKVRNRAEKVLTDWHLKVHENTVEFYDILSVK